MIKTCYVREKGKRCSKYLTWRRLAPLQIDTHQGSCLKHGLVAAWNAATEELTRLRFVNAEEWR